MRLRREDGASIVEFALVTPLLFMLLFGIIGFGIAFLRVQSIRTAVREGGRAAAVGASVSQIQQKTVDASSGAIPAGQNGNVAVSAPLGGFCNPNNIGQNVTVTYNTANLPDGGVIVRIPLFPDIVLNPVISAAFRCEV